MKRGFSILVVILLAASVVSATEAMAQAAQEKQIEGMIKSVDPDRGVVVLEDGTRLMIPAAVRVQRDALREGVPVKASYEESGGQKIVTSIEVPGEFLW
jgi:Cu/Ag efflux protein CusF